MKNVDFIIHPFAPIYNKDSKVLLLGSFPSPKSREVGFYFSHPQNRFFKVIADLFNETPPSTIEEKTKFLLQHKIALWDVIESCEIVGASDSSIKNVKVNDINSLLKQTNITAVFCLGNTATKLYKKYVGENCFTLPSTSPANCAVSFTELKEKFKQILPFLK